MATKLASGLLITGVVCAVSGGEAVWTLVIPLSKKETRGVLPTRVMKFIVIIMQL
jgi:hypothetical protein